MFEKDVLEIMQNMDSRTITEEEIKRFEGQGLKIVTVDNHQYVDVETVVRLSLHLMMYEREYARLDKLLDKLIAHKCKEGAYSSNCGYCYIGVDSNWEGFYKIGKTVDKTCKSREAKVINPNYKIIYRTDACENYTKLEQNIHEYLKDKRCFIPGFKEWFHLSESELKDLIVKFSFKSLEK